MNKTKYSSMSPADQKITERLQKVLPQPKNNVTKVPKESKPKK